MIKKEKLYKAGMLTSDSYYEEAKHWYECNNFVREYHALKKLLPLLNYSSPKEKNFAVMFFVQLANACQNLALLTEEKECLMKATKILPRFELAVHLNYLSNALEDFTKDDFRALYKESNKYLTNIVPYPKKFYTHKRIRVGFMSADFNAHAAISWFLALLIGLDKKFFKVYCYSSVRTTDEYTEYFRSVVENWRDIKDLTDKKAAKLIRKDEIDILFNLSGYTAGGRLRIAAYRPATVQMSGVGYMNSTGLDCFDYFLSDIYCAGDESYFTEKLIKLPHSHICYEPPVKIKPADLPPCLKNNFVTFGSFNKFLKMTDSILIAWKKILDAVPNSRLILKYRIFDTDDGKIFAGERLKNFGFDLSRVEMRPYSSNHLVEYNDVDIALDTFPYTGGVTTCEALYMGVPVVSLYGDRHGTRFGLSILKNIGLGELAVNSYEKYINLAVALSRNKDLLSMLRKNLRTMMTRSPLMDISNYIHEVEQAFIKILEDERKVFEAST